MVRQSVAIVILLLAIPASAQEQTRREKIEMENLISRVESLDLADEVASMQPDEAINFLGTIIRRRAGDSEDPVAKEAISLIGTFDGHAERYVAELEKRRGTIGYDMYRSKFFSQLSFFASNEAIRVLAGYLDDEVDAPTDEELLKASSGSLVASNAVLAVQALEKLDLDGAPSQTTASRLYTKEYTEAWRKWWSEVGAKLFAPESEPDEVEPPVSAPPRSDSPGSPTPSVPEYSEQEESITKSKQEPDDIVQPREVNWWLWFGIPIVCLTGLLVAARELQRRFANRHH